MNSSTWRVALLYNLKHPATLDPDMPYDALADYDTVETVQAVEDALRSAGYQVIPLEADHTLLDSIRQVNPDLCFNMARGMEGQYRESQVPALLDMLNIPYTGSGVLTLAMTRNKAETKRIWRDCGLPTAPFQVMRNGGDELDDSLTFPLFVKPLCGKLGMGIDAKSRVCNQAELQAQVERITQLYYQPALVERCLRGREFVVSIMGNPPTINTDQHRNPLYDSDGYHVFPILEIDTTQLIDKALFGSAARLLSSDAINAPIYPCPADIPEALKTELTSLATAAFKAVGAADMARIDLRLDENGSPNLLSINVLPSLESQQSNFAQMAMADNISFNDLIGELLDLALERHRLIYPLGNVFMDNGIDQMDMLGATLSSSCSGDPLVPAV